MCIRKMADQRIEGRSIFGCINSSHSRSVRGIGSQTVNSFCAEGDELPAAQKICGATDSFFVISQKLSHKNLDKQKEADLYC
jgi:hypothetical protein